MKECCGEVLYKCCEGVLWRSVVGKCCGEVVLEKSVVEMCWRTFL